MVNGGVVPGGVRWLGRADARDPGAVKLAWSGAGFIATVSGTKISVKLQTEDADSAFFQPVIDGKVGSRFEVRNGDTQTVTLGDGLSVGDHTVELYRDTEGMYGRSVFGGFVDGKLKGAPAGSGRLIEVIGDSISAGYGNLGKEVHPPWDNTCSFSLDTESAYQSYGAMLGRALDAEVSTVARSGWGMYRDINGDPTGVLPSLYANAVGTASAPAWSFERRADAVVINLGTNDSDKGDPGKPYEDAYVAFLRVVRGHYPRAWIFLTMGPMTGEPMLTQMRAHLKNVAATFADDLVVVVDMPAQDVTSTGCDYHPNVAGHSAMAGVLAAAIRNKLGW
jgi:lysophospholipase L1-like esterase